MTAQLSVHHFEGGSNKWDEASLSNAERAAKDHSTRERKPFFGPEIPSCGSRERGVGLEQTWNSTASAEKLYLNSFAKAMGVCLLQE